MSGARRRAYLVATRGLFVALAASLLVFVTPRPLAIGSAIVAGVALVAVLIAVSIWVFTTRPGMSYFALGPADYMGRAKESTIDHIAAQIAAVLLALLAVLFWMVWLGLTAAAASFDTRVSRAETAQMLVPGPVDLRWTAEERKNLEKGAPVFVITSNEVAVGAVRAPLGHLKQEDVYVPAVALTVAGRSNHGGRVKPCAPGDPCRQGRTAGGGANDFFFPDYRKRPGDPLSGHQFRRLPVGHRA